MSIEVKREIVVRPLLFGNISVIKIINREHNRI